jgi:5,10-methylenetetrahydromethanopterin reductase
MNQDGQAAGITFGVRIPPCAPVDVLARQVADAEAYGFDIAWLADSQLLWRDVFSTMAVAALQTETITLATAVTNFATRHPSVVASSANTIAELAPGRVILGVGSGDSSVKPLSIKPSTVAHLRDSIGLLRELLDGQFAQFGDRQARLRDAHGRVPVHLAAGGPRTYGLAGEIADGAITLAGVAPDMLRSIRAAILEGCAAAGRTLSDLQFTVGALCKVTDDIYSDAAILKPLVLQLASTGRRRQLELAGIELQAPDSMPSVYPDLGHAEDWDELVQHSSRWVTDDMAVRYARTFCLFGTVEEITQRINAAIEAGATGFCFRHVGSYTLPTELIETFGASVLPRYRSGAAVPGSPARSALGGR